jgi:glycosyl transferase family 2
MNRASTSTHRLTVAVPVFNERDRVETALKELLAVQFPVELEVIIVDDGSSDGTAEVVDNFVDNLSGANVQLIRHKRNRGKGAALRTALAAATGDVFVPFDADLEYDPADIARLLEPITEGKSNVVFGTRSFGAHTAYSFRFVLGNKFLALWANILFDCYISDLETCYKMARTQILRGLRLRSDSFDIEAEVTAKLLRAGHRPYEMGISYVARSREAGKKIQWWDGVGALWTILRIRLGGR